VESRQLIDRFVNTETFRVVGEVQSPEEMASEIRKGRAYAGMQIPPQFTRDLRAGYPTQIQLLIDGSNSTTALQALNTGVAVALTQSVQILLKDTGKRAPPIELRPQMLYNPTMRSPNFFVPGVIGVVLQMSMTFILPSVFFSGFIFPRETMPWIFYALGSIIPTTYFIALSRAIILRGAHFFEYWQHLAILIAMSIALFCICALRFRKKI